MERRTFLGCLAVLMAGRATWGYGDAIKTSDVAWLEEVQRAPQPVPTANRPLADILRTSDGTPVTTLQEWQTERVRLRQRWLEFLGPMPAERPGNDFVVLNEDHPDGCRRQLIRYQAEAGQYVEGYLLRPDRPIMAGQKRPGIVALHQTGEQSIEEIAGLAGSEQQHLGLQLCREGHIVFCPRCYLWQTPPDYRLNLTEPVTHFRSRHPQTLGMHKMLFDAQRAVDLLCALPDVDPQRIGAVGHSLGAKEVLYLAAFDERIRAAVASEGGIEFSATNWHSPWYLGPAIQAADFPLNHHQLLALIAPRPFLILGGETGPGAADGDRSWPYIAAALPAWQLWNRTPRIGLLNHGQGHSIPATARAKLLDWLRVYTAADIE